ncbi:DNA polymerase III subunit alpha [Pontibacter sp. G13]|uniref:DNA polymerase III subunit alpha n=1 Tax=Pontibacter sp. G13 TaxID=3074898 RepID=UPI00288AFDF8|nr:DNA polymerase III subunit alpha [Pontibacter sp. G13]WNJ20235.1 DNA polymerase III subunit alpha [Pontibacter sp. G13]
MPQFVHLHNHTEFSLLDGAAKISDMTKKAATLGMSHIAITDHGNMFGVPKFVLAARKQGIKPIVGCEFYITAGDATKKIKGDKRYHQIMWAKNQQGYQNLVKLCSYGFTDGYYYKPRIDKEILKQHTEGLIASTCCLAGEVNRAFIEQGEAAGEEKLKEYLEIFGHENYYVEVQRHTLGDMDKCNEWLLRMAKKHDLKVIATNDVHYVNQEDSEAHDLLLALQTQSDYANPKRFRFTDDKGRLNPRFYFKSQDEMLETFQDIPWALDNTVELAERCSFEMNLSGDMILPQYQVPSQYQDMDDYLKAMVWERVPRRYTEVTAEIQERIDTELMIIKRMGYAGYFLIVQSFTTVARERGVYVGPGRGSAAGSVIAYILGIIDIDPLTYDLLFERFLNPERVSPPDIDIDFDDEGRQEVIDYVVSEYGRKSVSQVITYGTMGAKTALRDVGRTLGIPLAEVNRIAKMIPDKPGMTFKKALDGEKNPDHAEELAQMFKSQDPLVNKMMRFAKTLEGTARHTGVHACAVIIAPSDLTNYAPVSMAKDDTMVTQYDGPMAEMCGLLKMDFLGLKTLSILKTAIKLAKQNHGVDIDPEQIDITDEETYALYQRGDTVATFQFESDGMRKYLRQLLPTNIEDLIAMNALYRPGPMDNIPSFVNRKHGREPLIYPHDMLEPILKNTYGIMVYQEQIMQVARTMGGYSLGGADLLRRAMGKKKMDIMAKEKVNFVAGAEKNGVDKKTAEDVFALMEKFASYGFNKCLTGETLIFDAETGQRHRIEDLYARTAKIQAVATLETEAGKIRKGFVSDIMDNGIKPVYELTTALGKKIRATANHPFFTEDGWKRLDELEIDQPIATPGRLPIVGDYKASVEEIEDMAQYAARTASILSDAELPEFIETWHTESLAWMLAKIIQIQGMPAHPSGSWRMHTVSESMARQWVHFFLRLGIVAGLRKMPRMRNWEIWISGTRNLQRFESSLGAYLEHHFIAPSVPHRAPQAAQVAGTPQGGHATPAATAVVAPDTDEMMPPVWEGDICWDPVVSIEYIGERRTYDLEVPDTHNFSANDLIVHNSHAAAYSILAFRTAFMKAHYPSEYMAAVLTHNVSDIKKITFFIEECRRMGIEVLPPNINESQQLFSVDSDGQIRFGLAAIKGVGSNVVAALIKDRTENGKFESLFDLTTRIPKRTLNRKTMESLVYAGALDCFNVDRFRYFLPVSNKDSATILDKAIQYGAKVQEEKASAQVSLFGGGDGMGAGLQEPKIPAGTMNDGLILEAWTELEKLNYEKEMIGFFLSGHPLDKYKWQMGSFTTCSLSDLENQKNRDVRVAGIVTNARERISRRGTHFMTFTLEDFSGSLELSLFGEQYERLRSVVRADEMLYVTGAYQPRRFDPNEFEFRIHEMRIMSEELFEGMIKNLTLEFYNSELTPEKVEKLETLFAEYAGDKSLIFRIKDPKLHADIKLLSSEFQIAPAQGLIDALGEMDIKWRFH